MLSNTIIRLIILMLPTQLGIHFWPAFSRVAGIKIDYLSPTLYLLDLFILLLVILNVKKLLQYLKKNLRSLVTILAFTVLNTIFSISPLNTLFWWLRLDLYVLFFITLRLRKIKWQQIRSPLLISTLVIVTLEIAQLITQSSIGGLFYFLGERAYSSITPGIGRLDLFGREFLRPISTFSHANSLAGYLLVVFYLFNKKSPKTWYKLVPFLGILLTLSKTSITALALILLNLKGDFIIIASVFLVLVQPFLLFGSITLQSISDRLFFYPYFGKILKQNYITGTGFGNYIVALGKQLPGSFLTPSKLQPIHSLPFLLITEMGILGTLLVTVSALKRNVRKYLLKPELLGLLAIIIFTGVFDHYTWTLPQNRLILLVAISILV